MAARTCHWRRALGAGALVLVTATATAACGRGGSDTPASPTGSPTPASSPSAVDLIGDEAVYYPNEAQEYAELTVAAWTAPDLYRLAELATPGVHRELVELPGPPQRGWRLIRCEPPTPTAGSATDCSFHNPDGDQLWLTVDHGQLGERQAVTAVTYDAIDFPTDPLDYAAAYVEAWRTGNGPRVAALGTAEATAALDRLPPVAELRYAPGPSAGALTTVIATVEFAAPTSTAGPTPPSEAAAEPLRLTISVNPTLLGEPQAVRRVEHELP